MCPAPRHRARPTERDHHPAQEREACRPPSPATAPLGSRPPRAPSSPGKTRQRHRKAVATPCPPVSRPTESSRSSRPRNDRQTPCRRQIPIDRTARTAAPNPPAVSSPEASPTPADRVRGTGPATAGVRQPFTTTDIRRHLGHPKSGHRVAAKGVQFSWRWNGGTISLNLRVIWEMSVIIFGKPHE